MLGLARRKDLYKMFLDDIGCLFFFFEGGFYIDVLRVDVKGPPIVDIGILCRFRAIKDLSGPSSSGQCWVHETSLKASKPFASGVRTTAKVLLLERLEDYSK